MAKPAKTEPDEIEVTPAMIEAGAVAYWRGDTRFEDAADIVREIYREMERARVSGADEVPGIR